MLKTILARFSKQALDQIYSEDSRTSDLSDNLRDVLQTEANDIAPLSYRNAHVKDYIHQLKFKRSRSAAKILASHIADIVIAEVADFRLFSQAPVVIAPIPLTFSRRLKRGYNQSSWLIDAITVNNKIVLRDNNLLRRLQRTTQSHTKSRTERLQNSKGSITVRKNTYPKDSLLIIIDDVTTTGGTFAAAKSALRECGFTNIVCIAAAH